jgi:hypothetical protein
LPEAEPTVGAGEDELVEEVALPAPDEALGNDAAGDGAIEDLAVDLDGPLVPHPAGGRLLVDRVRARGEGHEANPVAGEQPNPHVGVAGPAELGVVPSFFFEGGAVDDRRRLTHERGVAKDPTQRRSRLQVLLMADPLPAPDHAVLVDELDAEQQDPLIRRRAADRRKDHRARVRQQVVVVVELQNPFAGRQPHGPIDVPGQAQRRPVVHVPVPARPVGQQPPDNLAAGVVIRPVGHRHLDLPGHGRGRLQGRAERALEQFGTVPGRHGNR